MSSGAKAIAGAAIVIAAMISVLLFRNGDEDTHRRHISGTSRTSEEPPAVGEKLSAPRLETPTRTGEAAPKLARGEAASVKFEAEGRDEKWAVPTENALSELIAQLGASAVRIEELACRASVCRLALSSADEALLVGVFDKLTEATTVGSGFEQVSTSRRPSEDGRESILVHIRIRR